MEERSWRARCVETRSSRPTVFRLACPPIDAALDFGHPREQPLGGGHLFQMEPFGPGLGVPLGFEIGPELLIVGGVLAGDEDATGTQAVGEGVESHGGLTRTQRVPRFSDRWSAGHSAGWLLAVSRKLTYVIHLFGCGDQLPVPDSIIERAW